MVDGALVLLLLLVVYRGYRRGLIREAADLGLLVFGVIVAFRTGPASEAFFASWTGASPLVARLLGGFAVFFVIQFVGGFVLAKALRSLGPLRPLDQWAGVVVSGAWFVIGATLLILVASAVPTGDRIERLLDDSRVAQYVAGEDSIPKTTLSAVVGDRVLESLVNLNQLIGNRQVVIKDAEIVELPVLSGDLLLDQTSAALIRDLLNLARIDAGEDPLSGSSALEDVAARHAFEMYEEGYFSHRSPVTGQVSDRVQAAGIPYALVGENLALAPTAQSVHDGLLSSPGHRENMLRPEFTRVGIVAIDGPLGLMVVQVFSG